MTFMPQGGDEQGVPVHDWQGCYSESWVAGLDLVAEAYVHPAKAAKALLRRILEHGFSRGYFRKGDLIADPFGGVATTAILATYYGLRAVSVELEPRFCELSQQNLDLHRRKWETLGVEPPVLLQGDSREFARLVGQCSAVVSSPPYADQLQQGEARDPQKMVEREERYLAQHPELRDKRPAQLLYGASPGQIGTLPAGDLAACLTSPPYAGSVHDGNGIDRTKLTGNPAGRHSQAFAEGYGETPGQIAALPTGEPLSAVLTSPPYAESIQRAGDGIDWQQAKSEPGTVQHQRPGQSVSSSYGEAPGQIGRLRSGELAGCVTSPPYVSGGHHNGTFNTWGGKLAGESGCAGWAKKEGGYGETLGQIGTASQETYWQAVKTVYEQVHQTLKPGGVFVLVLKAYVRDGKIVDLPEQTWQLLQAVGFVPLERCRAWLVEETRTAGLWGEEVKTTERKSFFRRLAEKKGSPRIDYESVLWLRRGE